MLTKTDTMTRSGIANPSAPLVEVRLDAIRHAARDPHIYEFVAPGGGTLPTAEPGAHIDVHLPNGLVRQYSLTVPDPEPVRYAVCVKRDAASRGGSSYMFDNLRVGQHINISALVDAGYPLPFSCQEGVCGSCETKVLSGTPDHRDSILTETERAANSIMMICCSGSKSENPVLDI